jgi:hypothetical protein
VMHLLPKLGGPGKEATLLETLVGATTALCAGSIAAQQSFAVPVLVKALEVLVQQHGGMLGMIAEYILVRATARSGDRLGGLAARLKESSRVVVIERVLAPLARAADGISARAIATLAPMLAALRAQERHVGRWLVLAELAKRAGDERPLIEALERARSGPSPSRVAWQYVAWALSPKSSIPSAQTRLSLDVVARLSDRPSGEKDMSFLFRLGTARAPVAEALLRSFSLDLATPTGIRSAGLLARHYGDAQAIARLQAAVASPRDAALRGLAVATLWDVGSGLDNGALRDAAQDTACELIDDKLLANVAWSALVRTAAVRRDDAPMVTDTHVRLLNWGRSA